jgi:hypothetical protein
LQNEQTPENGNAVAEMLAGQAERNAIWWAEWADKQLSSSRSALGLKRAAEAREFARRLLAEQDQPPEKRGRVSNHARQLAAEKDAAGA